LNLLRPYNNVRTHTEEEGSWETKNNVLGLATEDGGRQYSYKELKMIAQDRSRTLQRDGVPFLNYKPG